MTSLKPSVDLRPYLCGEVIKLKMWFWGSRWMSDLEQKTVFKVLIANEPILALMLAEKLKRFTKSITNTSAGIAFCLFADHLKAFRYLRKHPEVSQDLLNFEQTLISPKIFPRSLLLINFFFLSFNSSFKALIHGAETTLCDLTSYPPSKLQKLTIIKQPFGCKSSQLLRKRLPETQLQKLGPVCEQMSMSHCKTFGGKKDLIAWNRKQQLFYGFETFYEYLL